MYLYKKSARCIGLQAPISSQSDWAPRTALEPPYHVLGGVGLRNAREMAKMMSELRCVRGLLGARAVELKHADALGVLAERREHVDELGPGACVELEDAIAVVSRHGLAAAERDQSFFEPRFHFFDPVLRHFLRLCGVGISLHCVRRARPTRVDRLVKVVAFELDPVFGVLRPVRHGPVQPELHELGWVANRGRKRNKTEQIQKGVRAKESERL